MPVWVANYENLGNMAVTGVVDKGYKIILETKWCEI